MSKSKKGLVIVNTGEGKGKTTAALGLMMRAHGQGLRVCMIQFVKAETGRWGEFKSAEALGIEWHKLGDGFTWKSSNLDESIAKALHGWEIAQAKIASGGYDLSVLDEFTYPLHFKWLAVQDIIAWLKNNKPPHTHLVITGRHAPQALIKYADLVTEMKKVKHPFDQGIKGQRGIEF